MDLRARLDAEFRRRRNRNPRYSLRAFARSLGVHHSSVCRALSPRSRLTPPALQRLGSALGLSPAQISEAGLEEVEVRILKLAERQSFQPASRWIAMMTGFPLDDVNLALHRLLTKRRLAMRSTTSWIPEAR
jgi:hypothetical protein